MKNTVLFIFYTLLILSCSSPEEKKNSVASDAGAALRLMDLSYSEAELDSAIEHIEGFLATYQKFHATELSNQVPFPFNFDPVPSGWQLPDLGSGKQKWNIPTNVERPENIEALAFYSIAELGVLLRQKKITSVELTAFFIERLKKHGPQLECVITLLEEHAMAQARKADNDLRMGIDKGPLHGIPYGAKDLFAVEGTKTTWGATPYQDQILDHTATVVEKLEKAGAILVAKMTLGALAYGDVWFGGTTKNPWNLEQGSSGSSAGSASAVAAGLLPFALGTETYGSIVSPSTRCGTTGLRPTFGRVSRYGAMALCWSLDKVGPITRNVQDAAMVFDVIKGPDNKDRTIYDLPFTFEPEKPIESYRIGYLSIIDSANASNFDKEVIDVFRKMGANLVPVNFTTKLPAQELILTLFGEIGASFDGLIRSKAINTMVRQDKNAWPNLFRSSRFIPAAEYINAQRFRHQLMEEFNQWISEYDVIISPSFGGNMLLYTNLTGNPCVVLPNGFKEDGTPVSVTFLGNLFEEGKVLEVARHFQKATDHHKQHPKGF